MRTRALPLALLCLTFLVTCAHAPAPPPPGMAREGECCLEQELALTLLSGEVHTEEFRLNVIEYPD